MKNLFLFFTFITTFAFAQKKEGTVYFQQKLNLHKNLGKEQESFKAMIPEFKTSDFQLAFTSDVSMYKEVEKEDEEGESGGGSRMNFRRGKAQIYYDLKNKKRIEVRDLMEKKYRIEGDMKTTAWKLTDETKMIQKLPCMKATFEDTTGRKRSIEAWFTTAIPYSIGPESFGGLPGMILEISINDGEMTYVVQKIDFATPKSEDLEAPKGGTPTSEADFRKAQTAMMKSFGGRRTEMRTKN